MASISTANRLTGLATGLDIDSIIKTEMSVYENKVNTVIQKKDVEEIRQKLYRDILSETREFYNKYLDTLSKDSLVMSSAYKSVKFDSSQESAVTATSTSMSVKDTYTVKVNELASAAKYELKDLNYDNTSNEININGEKIEFSGTTKKEIVDSLNDALKKAGINDVKAKSSDFSNNIVLESTKLGSENGFVVNGNFENIDSLDKISKDNIKDNFLINGIAIDLTQIDDSDDDTIKKSLTEKFKAAGINVSVTVEKGEITLKNNDSTNIKIKKIAGELDGENKSFFTGKNADVLITSSNGSKTYSDSENTVTLDGVVFSFTQKTTEDVIITGKTNVTDTKDKIVNFINDYNNLIKKINTTINTKHDRDYVPLTSEQKEEMSEKEIELWESKVEEGQLYKDSDLSRVASTLKQTMRTVMSGSGFSLEKIGITPVKDYSGNTNGTFSIDEEKLTSALEKDIDGVMELFISKPNKNNSESNVTSKTGIIQQLKDSLYKEVMTSDSILSKKVGIEGTSTFTNNTITKSISDYETKIKKMQSDLAVREQNLYSKYAALETIMNKYNSQQSYLTSYLGM